MNASFFVRGPGLAAGRNLGEIDMRDVAPTLASLLQLTLPQAEGQVLRLKSSDRSTIRHHVEQ